MSIISYSGDSLVLIPGGGGSTKSGVRNQIQIGRYLLGDSRGQNLEFLAKQGVMFRSDSNVTRTC